MKSQEITHIIAKYADGFIHEKDIAEWFVISSWADLNSFIKLQKIHGGLIDIHFDRKNINL